VSRRVVLGQQNDGSMGLRVSAPGFDALTAIDDGHAITFDSRWTDIAKVYFAGMGSSTLFSELVGTTTVTFYTVQFAWPSLGYKPFVEVRRLQGNIVYDDYYNASGPSGAYAVVTPTGINFGNEASPGNLSALCVVYQIPVPSG
jgi:hypothetical protein